MTANLFQLGLEAIRSAGSIVYPTETMYALGGDGRLAEVADKVAAIKNRPDQKPLPLIVGDFSQLEMVTDWRGPEFSILAEAFWPGPLSMIVPAVQGLPQAVMDERGRTSVRITSHPTARKLCRDAGVPLVATSANIAGKPPAFTPEQLDRALCGQVDVVLDEAPWPGGGQASTVIGFEGGRRLRIHRRGAVPIAALMELGFTVIGTMDA